MAPTRRKPPARSGAPASAGASAVRGRKTKSGVTEDDLIAVVPTGLATAFVNARLHDKALAVAGLTEPSEWDGEMPELPDDIASQDHDTLSNLLAAFASCMSTATWYGAKARIERIFYNQIVDYVESVAILESQESNESKRKAAAATSEPVVAAKALAASAEADMYRFQTMASNLKLKHATVSRVGGFVGDEVEAEDQDHAPTRSVRGKSAGSERVIAGPRRKPRRR